MPQCELEAEYYRRLEKFNRELKRLIYDLDEYSARKSFERLKL